MKNKSLTMFVAAILIAVFHLWINVTSMGSVASDIEGFVQFICFIGVDMFFAISAFSIAQSNTENYKEFIKKRFSKIYNKFLLFAIIAFILESWTISRLLKVASGIELFARGGGSFLWFAPAILIVYLLLPLYKKVDEHYPKASPVFAILLWLAIGLLLTKWQLSTDALVNIILVYASVLTLYFAIKKNNQKLSVNILYFSGIYWILYVVYVLLTRG